MTTDNTMPEHFKKPPAPQRCATCYGLMVASQATGGKTLKHVFPSDERRCREIKWRENGKNGTI